MIYAKNVKLIVQVTQRLDSFYFWDIFQQRSIISASEETNWKSKEKIFTYTPTWEEEKKSKWMVFQLTYTLGCKLFLFILKKTTGQIHETNIFACHMVKKAGCWSSMNKKLQICKHIFSKRVHDAFSWHIRKEYRDIDFSMH